MMRLFAPGRHRLWFLRGLSLRIGLPLAAGSGYAGEWTESRQGDVSYTLCSKQDAAPPKGESADYHDAGR